MKETLKGFRVVAGILLMLFSIVMGVLLTTYAVGADFARGSIIPMQVSSFIGSIVVFLLLQVLAVSCFIGNRIMMLIVWAMLLIGRIIGLIGGLRIFSLTLPITLMLAYILPTVLFVLTLVLIILSIGGVKKERHIGQTVLFIVVMAVTVTLLLCCLRQQYTYHFQPFAASDVFTFPHFMMFLGTDSIPVCAALEVILLLPFLFFTLWLAFSRRKVLQFGNEPIPDMPGDTAYVSAPAPGMTLPASDAVQPAGNGFGGWNDGADRFDQTARPEPAMPDMPAAQPEDNFEKTVGPASMPAPDFEKTVGPAAPQVPDFEKTVGPAAMPAFNAEQAQADSYEQTMRLDRNEPNERPQQPAQPVYGGAEPVADPYEQTMRLDRNESNERPQQPAQPVYGGAQPVADPYEQTMRLDRNESNERPQQPAQPVYGGAQSVADPYEQTMRLDRNESNERPQQPSQPIYGGAEQVADPYEQTMRLERNAPGARPQQPSQPIYGGANMAADPYEQTMRLDRNAPNVRPQPAPQPYNGSLNAGLDEIADGEATIRVAPKVRPVMHAAVKPAEIVIPDNLSPEKKEQAEKLRQMLDAQVISEAEFRMYMARLLS